MTEITETSLVDSDDGGHAFQCGAFSSICTQSADAKQNRNYLGTPLVFPPRVELEVM